MYGVLIILGLAYWKKGREGLVISFTQYLAQPLRRIKSFRSFGCTDFVFSSFSVYFMVSCIFPIDISDVFVSIVRIYSYIFPIDGLYYS